MASSVSNIELDPLFVRALHLLHSKAKDSSEQLRQMLEDVLQQRQTPGHHGLRENKTASTSNTKFIIKTENGNKGQLSIIKHSPKHVPDLTTSSIIPSRKGSKDEEKKREAEKRSFDKLKQDSIESHLESKKIKLDKMTTGPSPPLTKLEVKAEKDTENDTGNTDADDFAMEMGLACVVCRNIEVSSGNQLVECQECHNLYHQECHKPPITDQDVNDPRLAWYCAKCAKTIKKLAIKNQKPNKSGPPNPTKESSTTVKADKTETATSIASSRLFKRSEVKLPLPGPSSNSNSRNVNASNKPTGLAGLAASLSGRNNMGKSSHSGNGSKTTTTAKSVPTTTSSSKSSVSSSSSISMTKSNPFPSLTSNIKSTSSSGGSLSSSSGLRSSSNRSSSPSTVKPSSSNNSSSNNGNSVSSSSSSNTGSSSSKTSSPMISADKRLQIMKKKAEKKLQEKRWK